MIELIAIHIKKTAGQSFRKVLEQVYGKSYFRLNMEKKFRGKRWGWFGPYKLRKAIPPDAKVLNGHFRYSEVSWLHRETGARVVTWLREPVEQVVSNYYFNKRKMLEGKRPNQEHLKDETLLEFAKRTHRKESISYHLDGLQLSEIFFVGITEHFSEDVRELAAMLGWGHFTIKSRNVNTEFRSKFPPPGEDEKEEIRRLLSKDIELYEEALALREKRRGSL